MEAAEYNLNDSMEAAEYNFNDYLEILKRRKWSLIVPGIGVFLLAVLIAILLPSIFKSTATILIEQQDISAQMVMSSETGYAEQRLQTINKRIMSSSRLLELIGKFNLYPDLKDKKTTDEILEEMRKDVALEMLNTEVMDRRTGRPATVTTAFTLSYSGKNPQTVHQVANALTTMFLNENLQVGEKKAAETATFFEAEMEKVRSELAVVESRVAAFKEKNLNSLPDLLPVNMQSLAGAESTAQQLSQQLRGLTEKAQYLEIQLSNTSPLIQRPDSIANLTPDEKRLQDLKIELTHMSTQFSEFYPDVVKAKAEIAELEARGKLDEAKTGGKKEVPQNPAYITLASQLAGTRTDMESVKRQIKEVEARVADYRNRIEGTPRVEESYKAVLIDRNNLQAKFEDLMRKTMEARVAQGMEKEQKGERFTLIDSARFPEKPDKPNRVAIILIGFILGIGAGVGFASLKEFTDDAVRSAAALTQMTSFPVLSEIPEIVTSEDKRRQKLRRIWVAAAAIVVVTVALTLFHTLIMDLNVFWVKLMDKFAL
jgi:polysaccharide chain length determinant protein (PEP-CTERM system associated)